MSSSTDLVNTRVSTNHQQLQIDIETQRRITEFTENTILAIAETDQDVEAERKKSDAAILKSIEAQNKLIQKLYLENSLLQNESEAIKAQTLQIALTHSKLISSKVELIQHLTAKFTDQEKLIERTLLEVEERKANNVAYQRLVVEQNRQRVIQEHNAWFLTSGL